MTNERSYIHQARFWLRCIRERVMMRLHPAGRISLSMLTALKDAYSDKRCFIIGNGPSLRKTNLSLLRDEYTFGLNRIYLLFPELGFQTTFLVSINHLVLRQFASEILALSMPKFLAWSSRTYLPVGLPSNVAFIDFVGTQPGFSTDVRQPIWHGATVTYAAMQLAYHMGFTRVVLVGVDHSFVSQGQPGQAVVSAGDDPNHFDKEYFGKDIRWELPDLKTSESAYRMARQAYEQAGRQIVDATIGGKLTIFPKVDYSGLF